MTNSYNEARAALREQPKKWLVTGAAGFIGSHLVEQLLELDQQVVGLDNFATGYRHNLADVTRKAGARAERFRFIEGDIRELDTCRAACEGVDYVLHEAALGSVPRSIDDPLTTNAANIDGFLNMLVAARDAGAKRFVYAASSAAYGDHPGLPKVEDEIGNALSPYAVTKVVNELYASVFGRLYGTETIGLRYFNVFGPRQDPAGAYAAVIPRWIGLLLQSKACEIFGDGTASRDFCYIDNVVQANILAAVTDNERAVGQIYNIACGERTTVSELFEGIRDDVRKLRPGLELPDIQLVAQRPGDVEHSHADVSKAKELLGYEAAVNVTAGLDTTTRWFVEADGAPR